MASPFVKALLDGAKEAVNSPEGQAEITALATALESSVVPAVENAIKGIPKPGGLAGIVLPSIEAAIVAEIQAIVAKYTGAQLTAFITTEIDNELNALGA